jgi:hypothetical protein
MSVRTNVADLVHHSDFDGLKLLLEKSPGKSRKLLSLLHETNQSALDNVLKSFEIVAKVFEREKLLDLLRRLMWMLNEESGNNCPNAALAIAHISLVDRDAVMPHVPVLRVYADDPSEQMREPVRKSISIIENASKD